MDSKRATTYYTAVICTEYAFEVDIRTIVHVKGCFESKEHGLEYRDVENLSEKLGLFGRAVEVAESPSRTKFGRFAVLVHGENERVRQNAISRCE